MTAVQAAALASWVAPVVTVAVPRCFLFDESANTWVEVDPNDGEAFGGGEVIVTARQLGDAWHLRCDDYYAPRLRCELTISQPLPRALATFGALLVADGLAESDKLRLPAVSEAAAR